MPGDDGRFPFAAIPQQLSQAADQLGVFRELLHQDPARAFEGRGRIRNAFVGIDEPRRFTFGSERRVLQQAQRERLEAGLAGDLPLGAPLRLERQIQIFEPRLGVRLLDRGGELRRELALLLDALQHGRAALLELAQVGEPLFEQPQLDVVEPAGGFLAIAGDEWNGGLAVEQGDGGLDLRQTGVDLFSDALSDRCHSLDKMMRHVRAARPTQSDRRDTRIGSAR